MPRAKRLTNNTAAQRFKFNLFSRFPSSTLIFPADTHHREYSVQSPRPHSPASSAMVVLQGIQTFFNGLTSALSAPPPPPASAPESASKQEPPPSTDSQRVTVRDFSTTQLLENSPPPNPNSNQLYVLLVAFAGLLMLGVCLGKPGMASISAIPQDQAVRQLSDVIRPDAGAPRGEWTSIVLHHSASLRGSAKSFDEFHRAVKGWRCLGYHFVVGNGTDTPDGIIEPGPRWKKQEAGAHANSLEYNSHGIGICLVGKFETEPPTPEQYENVKNLIIALMKEYHIPKSRILGHTQVRQGGGTICPGKRFPMQELLNDL